MIRFFDARSYLPGDYGLVAKNTGLLFGLQVAQRLVGLASTYFIVRSLDQVSFGTYQFALSAIGVVSIFALPGMNNAVMQSAARGFRGSFRASIHPSLAASVVGALLLVAAGVGFAIGDPEGPGRALVAAAPLFPLAYGLTQWKGFRSGLEDFSGVVTREGAAATATSLLLIAAVLYVSNSIVVLVGIILVVQCVLNAVATRSALRSVSAEEPVEAGSIRYGLVTTGYMVLSHVAIYIDKLLIYAIMTPASLGVFVAAEKIPELVKSNVKNLGTALAPRFARHRHYTRRVDRSIRMFSVVAGLFIVLFAFTVLPWFVVLIFGEEYRQSIPYAQALMCSVAIANSVPLKARWIKSQKDSAAFRDVNAGIAICRIAASATLIPLFGITGAVASAILTRVGGVVAVNLVMRKRFPMTGDD